MLFGSAGPFSILGMESAVQEDGDPFPQFVVLGKELHVAEHDTAAAVADDQVVEIVGGRAHLRVSPDHPANRGIVDLQQATSPPGGEVRYAADVVILRPADPARARRVMIAEVPNRGIRVIDAMVHGTFASLDFRPPAPGAAPVVPSPPYSAAANAGNGFLMRRGYTLVWVGWQADLPRGMPLMRADLPTATDHGKPITGKVETSTVFDVPGARSTIDLPYAAAAGHEGEAVLTVRAYPDSPTRTIAPADWHFSGPRQIAVDRPADADAGAIYRFVYTAADPIVAGLGFAATRDVVSFLRHAERDEVGTPNPLIDLRSAPCAAERPDRCRATGRDTVDFVIGAGTSQSGRYLRDMLYLGFNDDGAQRKVFDGAIVHIAGSRRTFTNRRWAEPGRFSRQHEDPLVYGNQFPFNYAVATDRLTGARDGILARCMQSRTCPKLFHVDGSSEFWNAGASLVASDGAGRDAALPADVRAYMIASAPHAAHMGSPATSLPPSTIDEAPVLRALLIDMDQWLSGGTPPPPSRWPSIARGELAPAASREAVGFPDYAGLAYSGRANPGALTDYDTVPARSDPARHWQILVPTTDGDGNDRAGIRLPDVAVPRGTFLGWNPRKAGYAEGDLSLVFGSYLPFAASARERAANGDPRRSFAERYGSEAEYQRLHQHALAALKAERLFLDGDD